MVLIENGAKHGCSKCVLVGSIAHYIARWKFGDYTAVNTLIDCLAYVCCKWQYDSIQWTQRCGTITQERRTLQVTPPPMLA